MILDFRLAQKQKFLDAEYIFYISRGLEISEFPSSLKIRKTWDSEIYLYVSCSNLENLLGEQRIRWGEIRDSGLRL